jgi:flagellar export protein FliJ
LGGHWFNSKLPLPKTQRHADAMTFQLQGLLDLRRDAEKSARQSLQEACAARIRAEEEYARLVARWREADDRFAEEARRLATGPTPTTAAQATARELYLGRLHEEAGRLAKVAEDHRTTVLARAQNAERSAQTAYEKAHREYQAVEELKERALAEEKSVADRRAEDDASDLAQSAFVRARVDQDS